jgi:hypothetical protein
LTTQHEILIFGDEYYTIIAMKIFIIIYLLYQYYTNTECAA